VEVEGADGDIGPHAVMVLGQGQASQLLDDFQPVLDRLGVHEELGRGLALVQLVSR
jgi:hypothetical protein